MVILICKMITFMQTMFEPRLAPRSYRNTCPSVWKAVSSEYAGLRGRRGGITDKDNQMHAVANNKRCFMTRAIFSTPLIQRSSAPWVQMALTITSALLQSTKAIADMRNAFTGFDTTISREVCLPFHLSLPLCEDIAKEKSERSV